jgi:hypothetical protein
MPTSPSGSWPPASAKTGRPTTSTPRSTSSCRAARQRYNAEHDKPLGSDTCSEHLLPGAADYDRYRLRSRHPVRGASLIRDLVRGSLRDGHEHAADLAGFRLGVIVRADRGHETYAAMTLQRVPGCAADAWFPEVSLPERDLLPAEQIWSNLMDPKAAAELLDEDN